MYYEEDYHKVVRENEAVLKENAAQRETIASLRATISRLREYAMRDDAWHKDACAQWRGSPCDCGYDALCLYEKEGKI